MRISFLHRPQISCFQGKADRSSSKTSSDCSPHWDFFFARRKEVLPIAVVGTFIVADDGLHGVCTSGMVCSGRNDGGDSRNSAAFFMVASNQSFRSSLQQPRVETGSTADPPATILLYCWLITELVVSRRLLIIVAY